MIRDSTKLTKEVEEVLYRWKIRSDLMEATRDKLEGILFLYKVDGINNITQEYTIRKS